MRSEIRVSLGSCGFLNFAIAILIATIVLGFGWQIVRRVARDKTISVCEIPQYDSEFDGQTLSVKGQLRGFHYLILTDKDCSKPTALLVDLDAGTRKSLFYRLESRGQSYLIDGNLDLSVRLVGFLRTVNRTDPTDRCYVPENDIVDSKIRKCLVVSSADGIELFAND